MCIKIYNDIHEGPYIYIYKSLIRIDNDNLSNR